MTLFPVLMYYFWICLWFYDGKLVHPSSPEDIQPFLWRMWSHIRNVCILVRSRSSWLIWSLSGRQPQPLRVESILWQRILPVVPCAGLARLSARRSSRTISRLQNSYV